MKIKLFLEFVSGNKESLFAELPKGHFLTYDEISKKLNCTIDDIEGFEQFLDENIKPGETFHGSLDETPHDDLDQNRDMIDQINSWEDYMYMWERYKDMLKSNPSYSHSDEGL
jgi:hypothetical protein